MQILFTVLVTFFAGMGAGLGTGFAGMSAAAVISPMLITFLHMDPYMAVGIALSSDVLASAISAYTYHKNKNLDIKNGLIMMASVLAFTVVGSYVAKLVPSTTMGGFSVFMTFLLGIKFIVRPVMTTKEAMTGVSAGKRAVQSVACGVLIGFICGFIGAGGGMMMLLILTSVMGYELKTAVGTSVFIMTFTALTGAVSHFLIGGLPNILVWVLCVIFTLVWARIAAVVANKAEPKTLNRATGVVLVVLNGQMSFHLSPLGDLLALAAALMWAVYSILIKKYTEQYDNFIVTRRVFLWAFLTAVPLMLLTDGMPDLAPLFTQPKVLISWLFLGVMGNAVCFAIWNIAFKALGVVVTNNYLYASPFVTVFVGWLLLGEPISVMSIIGAVLITVGVIFAYKEDKPKAE